MLFVHKFYEEIMMDFVMHKRLTNERLAHLPSNHPDVEAGKEKRQLRYRDALLTETGKK